MPIFFGAITVVDVNRQNLLSINHNSYNRNNKATDPLPLRSMWLHANSSGIQLKVSNSVFSCRKQFVGFESFDWEVSIDGFHHMKAHLNLMLLGLYIIEGA